MPELIVRPDANAVHEEAVQRIVDACARSQAQRGIFTWALCGGSTPRTTYERLRNAPVDWQRVEIFWSDERVVPPDSPHSNQRMAREALLDFIPIPDSRVHPMDGTADPEIAARDYEVTMRRVLGDPPRVDLALLGIGDDAHTASLFPHTPALRDSKRLVAPNPAPVIAPRLTWTPAALRAARALLVLVVGERKREALQRTLYDDFDPDGIPIQSVVHAHPDAVILADRDAAGD